MATISITSSVNLDLDKFTTIVEEYNITRDALINRFLVKVLNGTINLDSFLKDDLLGNSEVFNLTEQISELESYNFLITISVPEEFDRKVLDELLNEYNMTKVLLFSTKFNKKKETENNTKPKVIITIKSNFYLVQFLINVAIKIGTKIEKINYDVEVGILGMGFN